MKVKPRITVVHYDHLTQCYFCLTTTGAIVVPATLLLTFPGTDHGVLVL